MFSARNTAGYIAWSPSSWPNGAPYQARGSLPSHASVFPVALFAFPALKVGQKTKSRSRKLTHGFSGKWSNEKCFQFCRRFRVFQTHVHKFGANSFHGEKYGTMNRWLNFDFASRNDVQYAGCKWGAHSESSDMNVCAAATTNVKWDKQTKPPCAQRNSTQQTVAQQNTQTQLEIKAPTLHSWPSSEHHASLGTSIVPCRKQIEARPSGSFGRKTVEVSHVSVFRFRPSEWLQEYRTVGDTRWHSWHEVIWELTRSVRMSNIQLECGWIVHRIAQM